MGDLPNRLPGFRRISPAEVVGGRRSVLAQWRGIDLAPLEKEAADAARSLRDLLPATRQRYRIEQKRSHAEILRVWNRLLDPALTAHAQPAGLRNGTLFVKVDSSVWLDEIVRYRRHEMLERLQHAFGRSTVQKLSFRVG